MKTYIVDLKSEASNSFMAVKAAQSMDIDVEKKLHHHLEIDCDIESSFNVGIIVGNSGSGKTTLAKQMFGVECFESQLKHELPIIDQFPTDMLYNDRANILNSVGLSQVVCWIRPVATLSNGQRFRAEAALKIAFSKENEIVAIDEWTSVVDRTVGKAMSFALQKAARRYNKRFVLCSCHYDVIEWLEPDWIVDCNTQEYEDRRLLRPNRQEKLDFEIREVHRSTWKMFSRYHYLSKHLPGGKIYCFGLFHNNQQIGFQCFANYIPTKAGTTPIYHSNRTVVHPDVVGLGLGLQMINACSKHMREKYGYKIMAKFSNIPLYKAKLKCPHWKLNDFGYNTATLKISGKLRTGTRKKVKWYSFRYID